MKLVLEHEPDNEFDDNAIAVKAGNVQIGYVPKQLTKTLIASTALDFNYEVVEKIEQGWKASAKLTSINKTNPTWTVFVMELLLTAPAKRAKKRRRIA